MRNLFRSSLCFAALFVVAACSSSGGGGSQSSNGGAGAAHYKVGNPYQVQGVWYYPKEDYSYDESGIASWYGSAFHGGATANGESFNKDELTAAHRTLPLPTLARVTNLDNGRAIVVRINDRGPFSNGRIIDVSQRAAQLLGFEGPGTAKVRVQVLADESRSIAEAMGHYGREQPVQVAANETPPAGMVAEPPPSAIDTQSLTPTAVETKQLEPVRTTPAIHQQLVATEPVAQVMQLPVTGASQIYIQAGAFTVLENATKLQQQLASFGHSSISDIAVNGTTFHRVRLGPISDVATADKLLTSVHKAGMASARTVVN